MASEKDNKITPRRRKIDLGEKTLEIGKLPPQATELEEAVLGALLLEKNALTAVIDIIKPEAFYIDAHQRIFNAIFTLFNNNKPIDILTVTQQLKQTGELELVGGAYYISKLSNRVASSANVEYHARLISQKFIQRELIRVSTETIRDAYEESTDVLDLLDKAESNLFAIAENNIRRSYNSMGSLMKEAISLIEKAREQKDGISGVPSGFANLDRVTAGWQKTDLIIVAARPGMGKTAFVLSLARNAAVDFNIPVAFFSLEMSSVQLVNRLISAEAGLGAEKLKKGTLEDYEWQQLLTKTSRLKEAKIFIDDTAAINIFELRAKVRRLKAEHNIGMIIIDYLQLMTAGGEGKGNREQEISTISRSLKGIAKELDVPIIVLSQLNRMVESRTTSKRPQLSDLRESGAIEQDADMVIFLYRPEYYKIFVDDNNNSTEGLAQVIIAKHRNGALEDVNLRFIGPLAKFTNYDQEDYNASMANFINNDFDNRESTVNLPSRMNSDISDENPDF
jgi:replicative DNA helicase